MKRSKKQTDFGKIESYKEKFRKLSLEKLYFKLENHYNIMFKHAQIALKQVIEEKKSV